MRITIIFLALFLGVTGWSQEDRLASLSFGPTSIGESRLDLNLRDFKINIDSSKIKTKAHFLRYSVQWIRTTNNLLIPRARIGIRMLHNASDIHLVYLGQSIIPEKRKSTFYSEIYVSLFSPTEIDIIQQGKKVGRISIQSKFNKQKKGKTHLVDYSCSRYNIEITGLDDEYLTLGCRMERRGSWGKERSRLEITWTATNLRLLDKSNPPYISYFNTSSPIEFIMEDESGKQRTVSIRATIPKRLHRLKTAFGFGPYAFRAKQDHLARESEVVPAFMLYGNLNLTPTTSIRGFDALIWRKSIFNNFGLYFAYNLADTLDGKFRIIPLLGIQGLTFKYDKNSKSYTKGIYPQGFEAVYKHAFGMENYTLVYGMFISTSSEEGYENIWLRFGKGIFWELNYIKWDYRGQYSAMWGLSVGIPLAQFF